MVCIAMHLTSRSFLELYNVKLSTLDTRNPLHSNAVALFLENIFVFDFRFFFFFFFFCFFCQPSNSHLSLGMALKISSAIAISKLRTALQITDNADWPKKLTRNKLRTIPRGVLSGVIIVG
jgi:hypothetical protein